MATRDLFMGPYKDGKIDIDFIADKVVLPKFVVRFVMSDIWAEFYQTMMAELRAELPIPDRVHTIDASHSTIEIHSVPLEDDPYTYAKRLEERCRDSAPPISAFIVETRRERRTFSPNEIAAYTPRNPLKSSG